jgi:glycosyltransferase involved in cell wall biosynthesis
MVSAIIIFYNERNYLAAAIASVQAQSFNDWELILVDDGSTDESPAIARAAAASDNRIRYVQHDEGANLGMSASRNRGIAEAKGEFIGFLDGDDVWLPTKLSEQIEVMARQPQAGMIYGRTQIWRSWSGGSDFFYDMGVKLDRLYNPPILFNLLVRNRAQTPTTINALIRTSLVRQTGGFENQFRSMFEDQVFFAKALLAAPCYVSGSVWARYRQHNTSCTASIAFKDEWHARAIYLKWLQAYLIDHFPGRQDLRGLVARARLDLVWQVARAHVRRMMGRT